MFINVWESLLSSKTCLTSVEILCSGLLLTAGQCHGSNIWVSSANIVSLLSILQSSWFTPKALDQTVSSFHISELFQAPLFMLLPLSSLLFHSSQLLWSDYITKLCCVHVPSRNSWFVSNNKESQVSQRSCSPLLFTKRKKEHFQAMVFRLLQIPWKVLSQQQQKNFQWRSVLVRYGKKLVFLFQVSMEKQAIVFIFSIWADKFYFKKWKHYKIFLKY